MDVNYEDPHLFCCHCGEQIPSSYAVEEEEPEPETPRLKCDQCQMLSINGIACHETGCPNMRKAWVDGEWVKPEPDEDDNTAFEQYLASDEDADEA
jgi:hypothetical protein